MNRERRKKIHDVQVSLNNAHDKLELVIDEEQDALDNTPESFQETEEFNAREALIDDMRDTLDELDSVINSVSNFFN